MILFTDNDTSRKDTWVEKAMLLLLHTVSKLAASADAQSRLICQLIYVCIDSERRSNRLTIDDSAAKKWEASSFIVADKQSDIST